MKIEGTPFCHSDEGGISRQYLWRCLVPRHDNGMKKNKIQFTCAML